MFNARDVGCAESSEKNLFAALLRGGSGKVNDGGDGSASLAGTVGERDLLSDAGMARRDGCAWVASGVEGATCHDEGGDSRVGGAQLGAGLVVKSVGVGELSDGETARSWRCGGVAEDGGQ